jgi:hypothetical protein
MRVSLFMTHFRWLYDGSLVGLFLLITMAAGMAMRKYDVQGASDIRQILAHIKSRCL